MQKEFLEAIKETAEYFAVTQGSVLSDLIPAFVLENLNFPKVAPSKNFLRCHLRKEEVAVLQTPDEERFAHYRSLVREEFAKKISFFVLTPKRRYKTGQRKTGTRH